MKLNIIAEFCQNHLGSKKKIREMIYQAAHNGATHAKIQSIRTKNLTFRKEFEENYILRHKLKYKPRPYNEEFNRLKSLELSIKTEEWFVKECLKANIIPMTTIFDLETVDEVKNLGFDTIKVASYDCGSISLIKKLKKYWSNLVVSTGATHNHEIKNTAEYLKGSNYAFLHCVTIYPTPLLKINLERMIWLKKFTNNIGFSDHTSPDQTGLLASQLSIFFGAKWIERHFTILSPKKTKDGPVSINAKQLKELSNFGELSPYEQLNVLKKYEKKFKLFLGDFKGKLSKEELLNRDYYRGRFASKINGKVKFNWQN